MEYTRIVDYTYYYQNSNDDNGHSHRCPLGNLLNKYNQRLADNISQEQSNTLSTKLAIGNPTAEFNIDITKNALAMRSTGLKGQTNKRS